MANVVADESAIEAFLALYGRDAIQLASIKAEGGAPRCRWFGSDARAGATWAASQNSQKHNIYWAPNRVRRELQRKATKADIQRVRYAHVDIDPPPNGCSFDKAAVARDLHGCCPSPTMIVDSGGGLQAFWALEDEATHEQIEALNSAIATRFGGDSCWNVDRLMRVPGTVNYPGPKKRAAGRLPKLASLVSSQPSTYATTQLAEAFGSPTGRLQEQAALSRLGITREDPLYQLLNAPRALDRSKDAYAAACEMLRRGYEDQTILRVLLDPALPISAHCLDQSNAERAARRALEKARLAVSLASEQQGSSLVGATPYRLPDPRTIPPRRWLYGHQLLRGTLAVIVAPGGMGKTALTVGMALSLATGRSLLGKEVPGGALSVWLWNLEDARDELDRAISAACQFHDVRSEEINGKLFVDSGLDGAVLCTALQNRDGHMIREPVYDALLTEIRSRQISVLIVDPFVSSHQVPENDNGAIDAVAKAWARLAAAADCAIVLVHHTSKSGGMEITAERSRGAVALVNAARSVVALNRMDAEDARKLGLRDEERRRYFRAYDDKNNRAPPADRSDWYRLESVILPNGCDDDCLGDSVGVVVPWSPPAARSATLDPSQVAELQTAIAQGEWRESDRAESWAGKAAAEVFGLDPDDRSDRVQIKTILKQCIKAGWLKIERRRDGHREMRPWVVVGIRVAAPDLSPADEV